LGGGLKLECRLLLLDLLAKALDVLPNFRFEGVPCPAATYPKTNCQQSTDCSSMHTGTLP
jgi:hypothetical protein